MVPCRFDDVQVDLQLWKVALKQGFTEGFDEVGLDQGEGTATGGEEERFWIGHAVRRKDVMMGLTVGCGVIRRCLWRGEKCAGEKGLKRREGSTRNPLFLGSDDYNGSFRLVAI